MQTGGNFSHWLEKDPAIHRDRRSDSEALVISGTVAMARSLAISIVAAFYVHNREIRDTEFSP